MLYSEHSKTKQSYILLAIMFSITSLSYILKDNNKNSKLYSLYVTIFQICKFYFEQKKKEREVGRERGERGDTNLKVKIGK